MDKFLIVIGAMVLGIFALMLAPLFGGIAGWAVGIFFTSPFVFLHTMTGIEFTPWQWGASLGFVGQFFKSTNNVKT